MTIDEYSFDRPLACFTGCLTIIINLFTKDICYYDQPIHIKGII